MGVPGFGLARFVESRWFIGCDAHKKFSVFVAVNEEGQAGGVTVFIGGTNVPVTFAGSQGGFVGLDQANVE